MMTKAILPAYPISRPRRLRRTSGLRNIVRETRLNPSDFVYPLFVRSGNGIKKEIPSMPGQFQWSLDKLPAEVEEIARLGIPAIILFGIPDEKDSIGKENFAADGIIQRTIKIIKDAVPDLVVITDVCLCEYTDHGHCGIVNTGDQKLNPNQPDGSILNDPTLEI